MATHMHKHIYSTHIYTACTNYTHANTQTLAYMHELVTDMHARTHIHTRAHTHTYTHTHTSHTYTHTHTCCTITYIHVHSSPPHAHTHSYTSLHYAVQTNSVISLQSFARLPEVTHLPDINEGKTPLMVAAQNGLEEAIQVYSSHHTPM